MTLRGIRTPELRRCQLRSSRPPRGLLTLQRAWATSECAWYQSDVHSHTFPIMSNSPYAFGGKRPRRTIAAMRIALSRQPGSERDVSPLELFFDLVYVFAI